MDEQFMKRLETKAYYAVARAFAASGKLTFDTETILMDLQQALGIDDDTAMELVSQVEQDQEASTLKAYESGATKGAGTAAASGQAGRPQSARPATQAYMESPFEQPPNKKQKKAGAGSLPPPSSARAAVTSPQAQAAAQKPAGTAGAAAGAAKQRPRSVPSTSQGGAAAAARAAKPSRPTISLHAYFRVMQQGTQQEIEAYAAELNNREREIFTELLALGVSEEDPDLNELHRDLLRWYKLDQRQAQLSSQLAGAVA